MTVAAAARSADRDEHGVGAAHGAGDVGLEREAACLNIRAHDFVEARLDRSELCRPSGP